MKIVAAVLLILSGSGVYAKDAKIPFIVKQQTVKMLGQGDSEFLYMMKDPKTGQTMAVMQSDKAVEVPAGEISKIVKDVKNEICNTIENGEFKLWLKGEASGKILGIGASSESGIEVTVKCEKEEKSGKKKD